MCVVMSMCVGGFYIVFAWKMSLPSWGALHTGGATGA